MNDLLLKNCLLKGNKKDVLIENGIISEVSDKIDSTVKTIDLTGRILLPGMIDPHTHIRDLDQAYKEDWISASQAAVAGGVTTLFDMPNTIPPTTDLDGFKAKLRACEKAWINHKLFIGVENELWNIREMIGFNKEIIAGIKLFLAHSSSNKIVKERSFLTEVLELAKELGLIVAVHTEMEDCLQVWRNKGIKPSIANHDQLRNRVCSIEGTHLMLELTNSIKNKLYLPHVSTKEEIDLVRAFKGDNEIYCEATPHHLLLTEADIQDFGNFGKVNPPIRTEADRESLWQGVLDGTVDTIGSDHAPHALSEKMMDYQNAPSGFPGLETSLCLLYNEVVEKRLTEERLIELTAENPADIFGLENRGRIEPGMIADLVIIDPHKSWKIQADNFRSKAKYSPFEGRIVKSKIDYTIINGEIKFQGVI